MEKQPLLRTVTVMDTALPYRGDGLNTARERIALEAMRWAAARLRVPPEELRVTQYRALRERAGTENVSDVRDRSTSLE